MPEVFDTMFCLVEQSFIVRPQKPVNSDPDSLEAITLNHFMFGQPKMASSFSSFEEKFNQRKRVVRLQANANAIWSRWLSKCVPGQLLSKIFSALIPKIGQSATTEDILKSQEEDTNSN